MENLFEVLKLLNLIACLLATIAYGIMAIAIRKAVSKVSRYLSMFDEKELDISDLEELK